MSEIDFTARYQLLVALCREHAKIRRASRSRLDSETALKLAVVQKKIDDRMTEWEELPCDSGERKGILRQPESHLA